MANYMNLWAAILVFVAAAAFNYFTFTPFTNWLAYFPTGLYVFVGACYVTFIAYIQMILPLQLAVSDDRGN